ncbi:MAG: metal ABC transporter substrate-binding protein [Candidatus Acetothermia bacterium]|nr:metal ABC transporter substrate-binding protein [Candidatus Acetothermia bacterium]MDH7504549.1 metal ABC transporter substrate-binding protein [Candidatus Acetothermia bacterium]
MAFNIRLRIWLLVALALLVSGGLLGLGQGQEKPLVIATTAVLADFAQAVGAELIEVYTITPSGICPAHYDLRPSDLRAVASASLVLYHGIEPWLEDLIARSGNTEVRRVQVQGEWNIPASALELVGRIAEALGEVDPAHAELFQSSAESYQAEIAALAGHLESEASELGVSEAKVIAMAWQSSFVTWLGFNIVATYGPPEMLSLREAQQLVATGREERAALVIDNLQSGIDFGSRLAFEVGAVHVVLTNFPGAIPHTATYLEMVRYNADQLFEGWKTYRGGG